MKLINPASPSVLLTPQQMAEADRLTIEGGVSGMTLMKNAGNAVVRELEKHWSKCSVLVLCGPGNNGGDGFVIASRLRSAGWAVALGLTCKVGDLKGDAVQAAALWGKDTILPMDTVSLDDVDLVVDAVFGAGLNRDFEGQAANLLKTAEAKKIPIVAVDIPSGVNGATGEVMGYAPSVNLTVTFFRMKPGHKLLPGRDLCGVLAVTDIGIEEDVGEKIGPQVWLNQPDLWRIPFLHVSAHKYTRGHVLMVGGPMTGAVRLACRAARRVGAGLVSILCSQSLHDIYAADSPGTIVIINDDENDDVFQTCLADARKNVVLIGPGHSTEGTQRKTLLKRRIMNCLSAGRSCVFDADAIGAFSDEPELLFQAIKMNEEAHVVMTPHAGEFARLFPDLTSNKLECAQKAAFRSGAVIVLKGSDTVIAAPDGRALISDNASPSLATAGSGDVLAGLISGLLAQGMTPLEAAAAGVWIHGDAAWRFGLGLIAEDIPEMVPKVLTGLMDRAQNC